MADAPSHSPPINALAPADKAWCFYRENPREDELYAVVRVAFFQRWGPTPAGFCIHWSGSGPRLRLQGAQLALPAREPALFDALRQLADSNPGFSPLDLAEALERAGLYNFDAQTQGPAHLRFDQARARALQTLARREAEALGESAPPAPPRTTRPGL